MMLPLLTALLASTPAPADPVVDQLNSFTRALMVAAPIPAGKNVVASPFSVSSCLGLLYPGVTATYQSPLLKGLRFDGEDFLGAMKGLKTQLTASSKGQLQVANGVWVGHGYDFQQSYLAAVKENFDGEAAQLAGTPDQAVEQINRWVDGKTKGRVPHLLDSLDSSTSAVLANAISFDAKWAHPFPKTTTSARVFHATDGDIQAQTMAESLSTESFTGSSFSAVELPYASQTFNMLVLLPKPGEDPLHLLKTLDLSRLPKAEHKRVSLQLPKFKFTTQLNLLGSLKKLGLGELLSGFNAQPMLGSEQPMMISQLLHGAAIEVDENGTKAAAATIGVMMPTGMRREPEMDFFVDRPFAFVIRDQATGAPLFVGAVYEPER